jgi:hypothetical protein
MWIFRLWRVVVLENILEYLWISDTNFDITDVKGVELVVIVNYYISIYLVIVLGISS